MKENILFCIFLLLAINIANAQTIQTVSSGFDKSKLEFGGTLGFSYGNSKIGGESTSLNISPEVGYRFSEFFRAGAGLSYIYRGYSDYDFSENYAGLTLYGRFFPIKNLILLAEPELYRIWGKNFDNRFVPALLFGGGAYIPLATGAVSFTLSYDVLQNEYSPYYNRLIYTIGYVFCF
jgi:hypothetical protein